MASLKLCLIYVILVTQTVLIYGEDAKSTLAFVIDNSASMYSEINVVKGKIDDVFDTAMNTNDLQIENIVLVTFSDPGMKNPISIVTSQPTNHLINYLTTP